MEPARSRVGRLIAAATVIFSVGTISFADEVTLTNGRTVIGEVESSGTVQVQIRTSDGLVTLPRSSIRGIRAQTSEATRLQFADASASRGDWSGVFRGISVGDSDPAVAVILLRHPDALANKAASAAEEHIRNAERIVGGGSPSPKAAAFLTRVHLARQNWQRAATLLNSIPHEYWSENNAEKNKVVNLLAEAMEVGRNNPDDGLAQLAQWLNVNAPERIKPSAMLLIALSSARQVASAGQVTTAITLLAQYVAPVAPELAWRTFTEIGDAAQKATTESLESFFGLLEAAAEKEPSLRGVFRRHAYMLASAGDYTSANHVAEQLSSLDPDAGAALTHEVDFKHRLENLSSSASDAYSLAVWARERGLNTEAARLFQRASIHPTFEENAKLQLQLIGLEADKKELAQIEELLRSGRYDDVLSRTTLFRRHRSDSSLARKAGELEELARYHKWRSEKVESGEADVLFQNVERLYLQGRYGEAAQLSDRLVVEYPNSEASRRVSTLRDSIRQATQPGR